MNDNTQNLTNALKGDSKAQGLWGEQILERTLEESGLEKGLNYELQKGTLNVTKGTQKYDLLTSTSSSLSGSEAVYIKKVMHYQHLLLLYLETF